MAAATSARKENNIYHINYIDAKDAYNEKKNYPKKMKEKVMMKTNNRRPSNSRPRNPIVGGASLTSKQRNKKIWILLTVAILLSVGC